MLVITIRPSNIYFFSKSVETTTSQPKGVLSKWVNFCSLKSWNKSFSCMAEPLRHSYLQQLHDSLIDAFRNLGKRRFGYGIIIDPMLLRQVSIICWVKNLWQIQIRCQNFQRNFNTPALESNSLPNNNFLFAHLCCPRFSNLEWTCFDPFLAGGRKHNSLSHRCPRWKENPSAFSVGKEQAVILPVCNICHWLRLK